MRFSTRLMAIVALALALPIEAYAESPLANPAASPTPFVSSFSTVSTLGSTVPANGDINPYGIAVVPSGATGNLVPGNILISNFNANTVMDPNLQGTGSTIVQMTPGGANTLFAQVPGSACADGIGLTTALAIVQKKFVVVGSLPTTDGSSATAKAGCLIVLDNMGNVVTTFTSPQINGPWDMTAIDKGSNSLLFVSNVLNGTVAAGGKVVNKGTVLRITVDFSKATPKMKERKIIADGFPERTDAAALVIGPTGLGLGSDGSTLFVADTLASRIAAIPNATKRNNSAHLGNTIGQGGALFAPLGLTVAPTGDILTVNGGDGNLVDTAPDGTQTVVNLDTTSNPPADPGAGTLFGLALVPNGSGIYFVDDGTNTLNLLH
jgi:hypothetical protein